jgi:hypothetical protein
MVPDYFQTIAEIAVAIVGFSGIIALFSERLEIAGSPINRTRFVDLVTAGFGAVFLSLIPHALNPFFENEQLFWKVLSLIMFAWFIGSLILLSILGKDAKFESKWFMIFPIIGSLIAGLLLWVTFGDSELEYGSMYFVGLLYLVVIASMQFSTLLLKSVWST